MACHTLNYVEQSPRLLGPPWLPQLQYLNCRTFLCDDQGHLFPHVRRLICKKTNHWGHPNISVWDESYQCCIARQKKKCEREVCWQLADMPRYFKCRGPLATCKEANCSPADNCEAQAFLDQDFEKICKTAPPVIWILGYPQKATITERKCFIEELTTKFEFVYLDLEAMMCELESKYFDCPPKEKDTAQHSTTKKNSTNPIKEKSGKVERKDSSGKQSKVKLKKEGSEGKKDQKKIIPQELTDDLKDLPLNLQRLVTLVKSIVAYRRQGEAFNLRGILEILKMAFLCFPDAKGYIVDSFPLSLSEAECFESVFWPAAAGIYFMSKKWSMRNTKGCNPRMNFPTLFLRSTEYLERVVEQTADAFRHKCLKVSNVECLQPSDFVLMHTIVADLIENYLRQLPKNADVVSKTSSKKVVSAKKTKTKFHDDEKTNLSKQFNDKPKNSISGKSGKATKKSPRSSLEQARSKRKSTVGMMTFENVHFPSIMQKTKSMTKDDLEEVNANVMNVRLSSNDLELNEACIQESQDQRSSSLEESSSDVTVITVKLRKNTRTANMDTDTFESRNNETQRSDEDDHDPSIRFGEDFTEEPFNASPERGITTLTTYEYATEVPSSPGQSELSDRNKSTFRGTSDKISKQNPLTTIAVTPNISQVNQILDEKNCVTLFTGSPTASPSSPIRNEHKVNSDKTSNTEPDEFPYACLPVITFSITK